MIEIILGRPYVSLLLLALALPWATEPIGKRAKAAGVLLSFVLAMAAALFAAWMLVTLEKGSLPALRWDDQTLDRLATGADSVVAFAWTAPGLVHVAILITSGLWLIWNSGGAKSALRVLFPISRTKTDGPWDGAFLTRPEIGDLLSSRRGMPLGLFGRDIARYEKNERRGWLGGHHMVISGTRGGKGVSTIVPAIFEHDGPVVAIDIKGELVDITRAKRLEMGQRVVALDPFDVGKSSRPAGKKRIGFNPLSFIRSNYRNRDAAVIADGLVIPETGDARHFSDRARSCIQTVIEVVHEHGGPEANLHTVRSLISSPTFLETLDEWAQQPALAGGRAAELAGTLLSMSDKERGSILSTVSKSLEWTSADEMRGFLGVTEGFNLERLLSGKIDVFIVVPLDQVEAQSGFMRLMSNLLLALLVQKDSRRPPVKTVLFVADEFTRLEYLAKVVDIATVAAGLKLEAIFILQDKGALDAVYGRHANSILGSCATIRVFNLGRGDTITAEWAARLTGSKTIQTESVSSSTGNRSKSTTMGESKEPLLSPDQFLEMKTDEMICFIRAKRPLKLKRIIWYERDEYRNSGS